MLNKSGEVLLREINESDTENIVKWRNKQFVKCNLFSQDDITSEQHLEYYKKLCLSGHVKQFIIQINDGFEVSEIGTTFLKNLDCVSRKAEFGIFIGEEDALGKGFGSSATRKMVEYAFLELHLNRVYLSVFADNASAIKAYEKSGFIIEGRLKQDQLRDNEFVDVIIMGITRNIWNPPIES